MQNNNTFLFFLEIEPLRKIEKIEVDDRSLPEEDADNLIYHMLLKSMKLLMKIF